MLVPIFLKAETRTQFHDMMEHNKIACYFLAQGPNADLIEAELAPLKGRIYIAFFEAPKFQLSAYR